MNLGEIRTQVRAFLDGGALFNSEEFTDAELDYWAEDATLQIHRLADWSWERARVSVSTAASVIDLSTVTHNGVPLNAVRSIESANYQLQQLGADVIRKHHLQDSTGEPRYYAVDRLATTEILLHPKPSASVDLVIEGTLDAAQWATSDTAEPDVPSHLHHAIVDWVLFRALMQLGDGSTAATHLDLAQEVFDMAAADDGTTVSTSFTKLGGGGRRDVPVVAQRGPRGTQFVQPYRIV